MSSHLGLWLGGMESMPSFPGYNSTYMPTLVSAKPVKNITLWSTQDETITHFTILQYGSHTTVKHIWGIEQPSYVVYVCVDVSLLCYPL
jgi:hypothetical protein